MMGAGILLAFGMLVPVPRGCFFCGAYAGVTSLLRLLVDWCVDSGEPCELCRHSRLRTRKRYGK